MADDSPATDSIPPEVRYLDDLHRAVQEVTAERYPRYDHLCVDRDQPGVRLAGLANRDDPDVRLALVEVRGLSDCGLGAFGAWTSVDDRLHRRSIMADTLSVSTQSSVLMLGEVDDGTVELKPMSPEPLEKDITNPCGDVTVRYYSNGDVYIDVELRLPVDLEVSNDEVIPEPPTMPPRCTVRKGVVDDGRLDQLVARVKRQWEAFDAELPPSMRRHGRG